MSRTVVRFGTASVFLLLIAAGCAVGPDYKRPPALAGTNSLPASFGDSYITNAGEWKLAQPAASVPRTNWWQIFNDEELNRLETMAITNNQQIALALANFDEARASVRIQQAGFYPQINADPSLTRQRNSGNSSPSAITGNGRTYNLFNATGTATWELDLWGRIRRLTESAKDQLAASVEDLESMKLSIQAEVATDYFTLRALDAQSASLSETTVAYSRALELTKNRQKSGIADEQDVAQAETQLKSVQAQIPSVDLQRAQTRHALAVLCGKAATVFSIPVNNFVSTNIPAIPMSAPSEWLEHRPDIAAAERRMAAANASVGVAKAAFYPKLTLNASGGFQSVNASSLFDWSSRLWAVGPSLELPLFVGGLNRAQLASAKASYMGTVATYRETVIEAFQDVEDQLAKQQFLASQVAEESSAEAAAHRALDIANNRYKAGVEQYLDVITAQTTYLSLQQSVIQLKGQRLAASVALIKALGAGREVEAPYRNEQASAK